jgi:lipid II isoglutaminyl synthase (glutamine-hydrolysing)
MRVVTNDSVVRVGLVFPDLLGTYGDRGNAMILCTRLRRRGIGAELVVIRPDQPVPGSLDCYVLGGGEDHTEGVASPLLRRSPLVPAWERGAVIVAVCAGFQLLGTRIELGHGTRLDGVGLLDAVTWPAPRRSVGDVVLDSGDATIGAVSGFENHRGTTTLARPCRPLGRDRVDGHAEGILESRLLATYLHGPVLVRNPELADHVLSWIVGPMSPLPTEAGALHAQLIERFGRRRRVRGVWRRVVARIA